MKITNNSTPKPQHFIWKAEVKKRENDRILEFLAAFSGVKIRHGEYRVIVRRGDIDNVVTMLSTVVDVVPDAETEEANNAPNNEVPFNSTAGNKPKE